MPEPTWTAQLYDKATFREEDMDEAVLQATTRAGATRARYYDWDDRNWVLVVEWPPL